MNTIENFINRVSADNRITDGVFNMENEEHLNVFQEHLEKLGVTNEEATTVRNRMVEGRYPDRQAYNANGILVTFPTPEYKQRAIQRGTHFEKNPKQKEPNISFPQGSSPTAPAPSPAPAPAPQAAPSAPPEKKPEPAPAPVPAPVEPPKPSTPPPQVGVPVLVLPPGELKKREDAEVRKAQDEYVEKILSNEQMQVKCTLEEATKNGFYNRGLVWYDSNNNRVGVACYDPHTFKCSIIG